MTGHIEVVQPGSDLYVRRSLTPNSMEVIQAALQKDAVARRILAKEEAPAVGAAVGVRLNINVFKSTGVAVHSIHGARNPVSHTQGKGLYRGPVINYTNVVVLKDAYFNVGQREREQIASGGSKTPMASVDGTLESVPEEGASFDGLEVSFNPKSTHLFVDTRGYAVRYAESVTVLEHRAYCRGRVEFFTELTAPARAGDAPSIARLIG